MNNPDPEWLEKQEARKALSILNVARAMSPLVMFGMIYVGLGFVGGFSHNLMIGIAFLAGVGDYLMLTWLVEMIKGKEKTIG